MNNKNENSIEKVSDLGLASLLVTLKVEMVGLEKIDSAPRINFIFKKDAWVEQIIKDYWNDKQLSVPVQTLFNNRKALINRMRAV